VVAITASVALAGDAGARYESGRIATAEAAIAAVKPWLPSDAEELQVTRVALVKEAGDLPAVAPDLPPEGLTRKGFPGPVWVVVVWARCDWAPRSHQLEYIVEASTGADIIRSGLSCDLPQPFPTLRGRPLPGEADQHTELERRLVETRVTLCNGGCRQYRRTHADCKRSGAELNGRALYRCRIQRDEVGGGDHAVPAETVCAALGRYSDHEYDARPLAECR
jgi:hypothetical protein